VEHAGSRAVVLVWEAVAGFESGVFGYRVLRDGKVLAPIEQATRWIDFRPLPGARHAYRVAAVNGAGLVSPPSPAVEVEVPLLETLGGWRLPPGGFDYLYDARPGDDAHTARRGEAAPFNLDGSWARGAVDEWDGSRPGEPGSAPGGVCVTAVERGGEDGGPVSALSIEDPGNPPHLPAPNNQRLYFLHGAGEGAPLDSDVTLIARFRVNPAPVDLPGAKGQSPAAPQLRGQVGIAQRSAAERKSFSLWLDGGRLSASGGFSFPVTDTDFQSVWATIEREGAGNRVRLYLNGGGEPLADERLDLAGASVETGFGGSYLQMGLAGTEDSGAIQVDYFGYKLGVHAPQPEGVEPWFLRGDATGDGRLELDDVLAIVAYLFLGTAPLSCLDAADVDDDGKLNVTDVVSIASWLFGGGRPPAPPFPACGPDPSADALEGCSSDGCREG
jgi:hypothetical protein